MADAKRDLYFSRSDLKRLGSPLTEGGEARIFRYKGKLLKIFKNTIDKSRKEKKVETFIQYQSKLGSQTYGPFGRLMIENVFHGYIMNEVKGDGDNLHQLVIKTFLRKNNYTNKDVLEIITFIAVYLQKYHQLGIIIGDISDYNIMLEGKKPAFIDVDSWGIKGKFSPDAYTEMYTDPKSYQKNGNVHFSVNSDMYSFAVLAFYMLARVHPFEGIYQEDPDMSTLDRMKKKISVLGSHQVLTKKIFNWNWMSPQLKKAFLDIFEHEQYIDITDLLKENLANLKYCSIHDIWYYSKYTECPICNESARVITAPIKVHQNAKDMPKVTLKFEGADVKIIINATHYVSKKNEVVHIPTGRRMQLSEKAKRIDFSENGKYAFVSNQQSITVFNENDVVIGVLDIMYRMPYAVIENDLYYVNELGNLERAEMRRSGISSQTIKNAYHPIFAVGSNGETCVVSRYPKRAIIATKDFNFQIKYTGSINEYAIKFDEFTGSWLFIYKMSNGKFRTMIFKRDEIRYDSDVIRYEAETLSNIAFSHNMIYDPSDEKIIAINPVANRMKEIPCREVSENSKLDFIGNGFRIINEEKIFYFGN